MSTPSRGEDPEYSSMRYGNIFIVLHFVRCFFLGLSIQVDVFRSHVMTAFTALETVRAVTAVSAPPEVPGFRYVDKFFQDFSFID